MASLPYTISGICYDTNGTTALANVKVTLRNERTNETITQNTNSSGQYVLDCGNLTSQYSVGDTITVFVIYTNYEDYEEHVIVEGGGATLNLTLVTVPASDSLKYFTVQDFYDYFQLVSGNEGVPLTNQIVEIGTMVEADIDDVCKSEFSTSTTVTQEYHDITSAYQREWFLDKTPVISVTTLQVNTAEDGTAESWTTLTEAAYQFEIDLVTGRVTLTGTQGDATTPVLPAVGVKQTRTTEIFDPEPEIFKGNDSCKTDNYNVMDAQINTILARYRKIDMLNT